MAAKRYQSWQLVLANLSGILYTMFVVFGATLLNTLHTCPTLYGYDGCYWIYWQAVVIVAEIVVNIVLFHYYNVRNQVSTRAFLLSAICTFCKYLFAIQLALFY